MTTMQLTRELSGPTGAPQLVLIHGITESRASWAPVRNALNQRYRVLAVDLRGHGDSPNGDVYDPIAYGSDVVDTLHAVGFDKPIVIGHSLGGVVASAVAALGHAAAVINVDQPLRLAAFKEGLTQLEPMLRGDADSFTSAISIVFDSMVGPLAADERHRIAQLRRADQSVVLATWASVFESSVEELDATIDQLAAAVTVPYLSLHGIDPGVEYAPWLTARIPSATVEVWPDHGHYPHLVDLPRFLRRVDQFRATTVGGAGA